MLRKGLVLLLFPLLLGGWSVGTLAEDMNVDSASWTKQYDPIFKKYTKRYFGPFYDWRWFKSQSIAESRLDPTVTSNRGAKGLMQLLPSTFDEIKGLNPHFVEIDTPRWNIAAGIYYDRYLYRKWDVPSEKERLFMPLPVITQAMLAFSEPCGATSSRSQPGKMYARNYPDRHVTM